MPNDPSVFEPDVTSLARRVLAASPARDSAAEGELYRCLAPRVRLYGLRHLRDEQAAADLVQQVLLMTIEKLRAGAVREPGMLVSFVLGTCRMSVLELRRTRTRHERLLNVFGADLVAEDVPATPAFDEAKVQHCLERLPERERSVLLMTFYDDRPAADIAGEIGLSEGNVRVIRHRGLKLLRDCVTGGETTA